MLYPLICFFLVMEALSSLMRYRISLGGGFPTILSVKSLDISHLIFADHLLVLCGADIPSFSLINDFLLISILDLAFNLI